MTSRVVKAGITRRLNQGIQAVLHGLTEGPGPSRGWFLTSEDEGLALRAAYTMAKDLGHHGRAKLRVEREG